MTDRETAWISCPVDASSYAHWDTTLSPAEPNPAPTIPTGETEYDWGTNVCYMANADGNWYWYSEGSGGGTRSYVCEYNYWDLNGGCGDGVAQTNEVCDDGTPGDEVDACHGGCLYVCGNGVPEGGEECDDGNTVDTDSCSNLCVVPD